MLDYLESLRKKPKHIRNQYAFWIASSLTLVIAAIWGVMLPRQFVPTDTALVAAAQDAPESSFMKQLGDVFSSFKSIPDNLQGTIEYENTDTQDTVFQAETIDLNALVASSTRMKRREALEALASTSDSVETQ